MRKTYIGKRGKTPTKPIGRSLSPEEIEKGLNEIQEWIDRGYAVQYATRISCGGMNSLYTLTVKSHPRYIEILNNYMRKIKQPRRYIRENGVLRVVGLKAYKEYMSPPEEETECVPAVQQVTEKTEVDKDLLPIGQANKEIS